jgi:hypothetical protein
MLFADPTIYLCPSCKKPMLKTNYLSYTVHDSTIYSDGKRTGYPRFTPNLAKCPNCEAIFFLHNQWAKKEDPNEETRHYKNIDSPDLADYIKAVRQGLAKDADEEIELRTELWRAFNKKGCSNDDETKLRQENCEKLLSLKEQKLNHIIQTSNPNDINNLRIEVAELKRNLGRFDECLEALKELPESLDWLKRQFTEKCKDKDTMVFMIKHKDELNNERH